jgi:hypothetical protein
VLSANSFFFQKPNNAAYSIHYFSFCYVRCSSHLKMFQSKVLDINDSLCFLNAPIFLMIKPFYIKLIQVSCKVHVK